MRVPLACMLSAALLCSLMIAAPTARADVEIAIGNFWEYEIEGSAEGLDLSGKMRYEVKETPESGEAEMFEIELSGEGAVIGEVDDIEIDGSFEIRGGQVRAEGTYDLTLSTMIMDMSFEVAGESMDMSVGTSQEFTTALDDYIGDDAKTVNTTVKTTTTVESDGWVEYEGTNISAPSMSIDENLTMIIEEIDYDVEVPAGDFVCTKIRVEVEAEGNTTIQYWYYNETVKNYVKMEGEDVLGLASQEVVLSDYGTVKSTILDNPWFLFLMFLVVVIVVVAIFKNIQKKKAAPELPGLDMDVIRSTEPSKPGAPDEPPKPPTP